MKIIDTHIHSIFRPTQFFKKYRTLGVESVITVAFYPIKPLYSQTLEDLFRWMVEHETNRLKKQGISCYCGIGIHPRSIPDNIEQSIYETMKNAIQLPDVVALAEIGLEKGLRTEIEVLEKQMALAKKSRDFPVILHTPGKNKRKITMDLLELVERFDISTGVIDHVSPENIDLALNTKLNIGLTIQIGKLTIEQFLIIIQEYPNEIHRFVINGDVGIDFANKFSVPQAIQRLRELGIDNKIIEQISYKNAEKLFKI
ncbi:MAG: TatD family hydrolase [Candidatus Helarchaeota archaeon]